VATIDEADISRRLAGALERAGYPATAPVASITVTPKLLADLRGDIALVELLQLCQQHEIQIADRLWLLILATAVRDLMTECDRETPDRSHLRQIMACMPARRRPGRPNGSTSAGNLYDQIRQLRAAGKSINEIMMMTRRSRSAVYQALKHPGEKTEEERWNTMSDVMTITDLARAVRGIVGEGYHVELAGHHVTTSEQEAASALRYTLQIGPQFIGPRRMRYMLREELYADADVLDAAREFAERWGNLPRSSAVAGLPVPQ